MVDATLLFGGRLSGPLDFEGFMAACEDPMGSTTAALADRVEQGVPIYSGDRFPEWRGNILAGGLAGQQIARLTMQVDRPTRTEWEETLVHGIGRIRDLRQGPDGYIYVAIEQRGGTTPIVRLEPVASTN